MNLLIDAWAWIIAPEQWSGRYSLPTLLLEQLGYTFAAVGIGVGQDTDLVVAQRGQVVTHRIDSQGYRDIVHFLGSENLLGIDFPGIQYLAAQGQDGLKLAAAGLLGRAASGVSLDEE